MESFLFFPFKTGFSVLRFTMNFVETLLGRNEEALGLAVRLLHTTSPRAIPVMLAAHRCLRSMMDVRHRPIEPIAPKPPPRTAMIFTNTCPCGMMLRAKMMNAIEMAASGAIVINASFGEYITCIDMLASEVVGDCPTPPSRTCHLTTSARRSQ